MKLDIQIISMFYYFIFGLLYSLFFNLFYKYLFLSTKIVKVVANIIFMLMATFIFCITNNLISFGIIHIYFLVIFLISFILGNLIFKHLRCKL